MNGQVSNVVSDPDFGSLSLSEQRAVLAHFDADFGRLSDQEFPQVVRQIRSAKPEPYYGAEASFPSGEAGDRFDREAWRETPGEFAKGVARPWTGSMTGVEGTQEYGGFREHPEEELPEAMQAVAPRARSIPGKIASVAGEMAGSAPYYGPAGEAVSADIVAPVLGKLGELFSEMKTFLGRASGKTAQETGSAAVREAGPVARDVIAATPGERNLQMGRGTRMTQPVTLPSENRGLALPPAPEPMPSGATVPRVPQGESVLRQALTALDEGNLNRIARTRKINLASLPRGPAATVDAIIDSMSPEELEAARSAYLEVTRMGHPLPDLNTEAGREAWHTLLVKTYFPEARIPKTQLVRLQKQIDLARGKAERSWPMPQ